MLPPDKMPVQQRLPGEIIQRIALFIPECDTFFALLDVFAEEGIGVLDHYLDLQDLMSPSLLWPTLRFHKYALPSSLVLHHIQCLSACVSKVQLPPNFNVQAVCPYLAPSSFVINASSYKRGIEDEMLRQTLRLVSTWKQLRSLTFTHLSDWQVGLALEFLTLPNITSFEISSTVFGEKRYCPDIAAHEFEWVVSWLNATPVRHFAIDYWKVSQENSHLIPRFYDAVANCRTLRTFSISNAILHGWNEYNFQNPLSINHFQLKNCQFDPTCLPTLFSGLQHSRTRHLSINNDVRESYLGVRGLRILLGALPLTNLTHLTVQGAMLADRGCFALAEVLPSLNLTYLDISDNHISDFGVNPLAQVLPSVVRLHELVMKHNFLRMRGIVALILDLRQNSLEKTNLSDVQLAFDRCSRPEYVIKVDYGKTGTGALLEKSPSGDA
ncbi:hypothetical protein Ae201684P_021524 [Aphanomyces euteiches]|uniref:F-box domain-containing protein n=2 Tax=Aphanomyces euteiches TaxID=100861 RepID=A0A6G0X709_9STRA|nr:hypothetical protein Ae201684_007767 [Aphanomyces euteiches]KAH9067365.1 hypothetical protein Ae201684P_021524 [Aphanomyces euteiches]